MKFNFINAGPFQEGILIMGEELGFEQAADGIPVEAVKGSGSIEAAYENGRAYIRYGRKIEFFRMLGILVQNMGKRESFRVTEEPQFDTNGIMIDVSRNAVLNENSIRLIIRKMALMGLNMAMLYTEDTYQIENRPYFGYMRGRYTYQELKAFDDYADIFGIELVPCIQTLAHLKQTLMWEYAREISDTEDILLAGEKKTYDFIEDMIKAASAPFRSKRVHIGMDEAQNLGLGKYLDRNGYRRRFDIMNEHLANVIKITNKYGLKPMIWSDMYFRLASPSGLYYDLNIEIPKDVIDKVPREVQLVYWDYYHVDEEFYREYIRKHKEFGSDPIFAGGIWTWNGISVNYGISFRSTNAALGACKAEGVREVITTLWGDNGAETSIFQALLGLQLYAEHGYSRELDMKKLKERFEFCTGASYEAFMSLNDIDEIPGVAKDNVGAANPSKWLLWQDVLTGLFDRHVDSKTMPRHYRVLESKMSDYARQESQWSFVFATAQKLCSVLSMKCDIGLRLKAAYDKKDMEAMKEIAQNQLPELYKRVNELRKTHRSQWMGTCKAFGWEVVDLRYGGLLARIDSAADRVKDYVEGRINGIEELEAERLNYFGQKSQDGSMPAGRCNLYHRIASVCPM